ncbi:MAG: Rpn family recombination-promoting nuclease/putative transposase [bacterium]|nr:Rpn family recombination-promoting nuclease/putative transposase [bacterium]
MQPDPTYKRIFGHEFMVEELMRWFVADLHGARELVDALDFSEMVRLHEQSVTGDAETPRRYADDMVWRVRLRGRSEAEGAAGWLHLVLVLEFQAETDFMMPLRIRNYVDNFHMEEWRGKKFRSTSRLLPVLPIVLYNGSSPWSAAPRVIDLVTPGASGPMRANVASRADPLFSGEGYLLLDTCRVGADDLRLDNAAALLAGLENPSYEGVAAQVAALRRRLDPPELEPLKVLMLLWAQRVAQRQLNLDLGIKDMAEVDRLHESGELEVRFSERALAEQEKYRAEGRAEGKAEGRAEGKAEGRAEGRAEGVERGIAAERGLLLRQVARKFDAETSERLGDLLSRIDDPEALAEVGDRIIECTSGEELISRVSRISRSGS